MEREGFQKENLVRNSILHDVEKWWFENSFNASAQTLICMLTLRFTLYDMALLFILIGSHIAHLT